MGIKKGCFYCLDWVFFFCCFFSVMKWCNHFSSIVSILCKILIGSAPKWFEIARTVHACLLYFCSTFGSFGTQSGPTLFIFYMLPQNITNPFLRTHKCISLYLSLTNRLTHIVFVFFIGQLLGCYIRYNKDFKFYNRDL